MTDPSAQARAAGAQHPSAPPSELVRSPLSDGEWHRLHPLTPLMRGGLVLLVVVGIIVSNLRDRLVYVFLPWLVPDSPDTIDDLEQWESSGDPIDFIIVNNLYVLAALAVLVVVLLVVAFFYLSWRFHTFRITDDDVEVRSGVLFRTQRRAPLDRVQGVNLTRPMIARIFGMAKLEVVGAGADSNVKLEYLSTANAETIRADILRLASGRRLAGRGGAGGTGAASVTGAAGADVGGADAAAAGTAPVEGVGTAGGAEGAGSNAPTGGSARATAESRVAALGQTMSRGITGLIEGDERVDEPESVVDIPVGRLVASRVISMSTIALLLATVATIVGVAQGVTWLVFGFVPALIGFGVYWVRSIVRSLRYSIAPTPDGVRITFGLLTTITEIVPPGRVHAVEVTQPILWRPFGWWVVRINRLTGRSASDGSADQFTTVLPVGSAADVERVLRLVLPGVPEQEWPVIVREGMLGPFADDTFVTTPRRARWIRPLSWRRNGYRLTDDALLLRRGQIWRKLGILPLARLQSFGLHQGPIDRMLGVAGMRGHVVAGPVYPYLAAVDRDRALALFDAVAAGSVRAASGDRTHRWAEDSRAAAPGDAVEFAAPDVADPPGAAADAQPGVVAAARDVADPDAQPGVVAASDVAAAPDAAPPAAASDAAEPDAAADAQPDVAAPAAADGPAEGSRAGSGHSATSRGDGTVG